MFNHTDDLIGKSFFATISEPWRFESELGQYKLSGKILKVFFHRDGDPLILCEVTPFLNNGKKITEVVGVNRYLSSQNVIESLKNGEATLNFMFQKSGNPFDDVDNLDVILQDKEKCGFLIGDMKLI